MIYIDQQDEERLTNNEMNENIYDTISLILSYHYQFRVLLFLQFAFVLFTFSLLDSFISRIYTEHFRCETENSKALIRS